MNFIKGLLELVINFWGIMALLALVLIPVAAVIGFWLWLLFTGL